MSRLNFNNRATGGYTLIEILVVIFIVGIITGVALISISRNETRQLKTFASELTQMVSMAEEQAMLEPRVMGIRLGRSSIHFAGLTKDKETKQSTWLPMNDNVLNKYHIPDNIQVTLVMGGKTVEISHAKKDIPQIIFSTNGDVTPFVMYVGKRGKKPRYAVVAGADGGVKSTALS